MCVVRKRASSPRRVSSVTSVYPKTCVIRNVPSPHAACHPGRASASRRVSPAKVCFLPDACHPGRRAQVTAGSPLIADVGARRLVRGPRTRWRRGPRRRGLARPVRRGGPAPRPPARPSDKARDRVTGSGRAVRRAPSAASVFLPDTSAGREPGRRAAVPEPPPSAAASTAAGPGGLGRTAPPASVARTARCLPPTVAARDLPQLSAATPEGSRV